MPGIVSMKSRPAVSASVKTGFTGMPSGVSQTGASGAVSPAAGALLTDGSSDTCVKSGIEGIDGYVSDRVSGF